MAKYIVNYRQRVTEYWTAEVEATSKEEALAKWERGDADQETLTDSDPHEVIDTEVLEEDE